MIKLKSLLTENISGKSLINVDIQPEYEGHFSFRKEKWAEFLNRSYNEVGNMVFLYNGKETLGMVSEDTYKYWLYDCGVSEEVVDGSRFYDKGYAFFRYCMDIGASEDAIANFVRFMYDNNIHDSREMNREMWAKYLREYRRTDRKEIMQLLRHQDDMIYIPDLMDFLKRYSGIVLTGGGINECLKEVEIALMALRKNYETLNEFTY